MRRQHVSSTAGAPNEKSGFNQEGQEIKLPQMVYFKYTCNILTHLAEIFYPNRLIVSASSAQYKNRKISNPKGQKNQPKLAIYANCHPSLNKLILYDPIT